MEFLFDIPAASLLKSGVAFRGGGCLDETLFVCSPPQHSETS